MSSQDNNLTPREVRARIARRQITGHTAGLCPGYAQANLVILPRDWAFDFLLFCQRNPKPCPLLEVLDPGQPFTRTIAEHADVRSDLPRYRIWQNGELIEEPLDITPWWRDDLVSFFLGCSFGFDAALQQAGLPVRHLDMGRNVPMFRTTRPNARAGRLGGPMVVSMRPMSPAEAQRAVEVSGRFEKSHGAPVQVGEPEALGIMDLDRPDFGEPVEIKPGEIPVFWACGVTPQAAVMDARPELAITHAPGHMFITDLKAEQA